MDGPTGEVAVVFWEALRLELLCGGARLRLSPRWREVRGLGWGRRRLPGTGEVWAERRDSGSAERCHRRARGLRSSPGRRRASKSSTGSAGEPPLLGLVPFVGLKKLTFSPSHSPEMCLAWLFPSIDSSVGDFK